MAETSGHKTGQPTKISRTGSRSRGLVVLFFILIVILVAFTVWSISYNWRRQTGKSEANVFNLVKDQLSNVNLPPR